MSGEPGGPEHPSTMMLKLPCPCPTNLTLPPDALKDSDQQYSHATALLLAGETFLSAARDIHKPMALRAELEKAALKLLGESAGYVLRPRNTAG